MAVTLSDFKTWRLSIEAERDDAKPTPTHAPRPGPEADDLIDAGWEDTIFAFRRRKGRWQIGQPVAERDPRWMWSLREYRAAVAAFDAPADEAD